MDSIKMENENVKSNEDENENKTIKSVRGLKSDSGYKVNITVECDFSHLTHNELMEYAFDSVWIKEQGKLRKLNNSELSEISKNGYTFIAQPKGLKVKKSNESQAISAYQKADREGKIKIVMETTGIEREQAELLVK